MGDRGQLRNREKRVRARSQREQILAWLAPSRVPGDARLRHDGGDPTSRQSATAQKNETPPPGKSQNITTPPLIRWSIQEIRRIAIRLARKRIRPAHIIAWVLLAESSPSCRSTRSLQIKKTTVMLRLTLHRLVGQ